MPNTSTYCSNTRLSRWYPGAQDQSDPFLARTSSLFEELEVRLRAYLKNEQYLTLFHPQKQVEDLLTERNRKEAAEREESRRIAEMFPILRPSQELSEAADTFSSPDHPGTYQHDTDGKFSARTPSPFENTRSNHSPDCARTTIRNIKECRVSNNWPPATKTILKTHPASTTNTKTTSKANKTRCFKLLRDEHIPDGRERFVHIAHSIYQYFT